MLTLYAVRLTEAGPVDALDSEKTARLTQQVH